MNYKIYQLDTSDADKPELVIDTVSGHERAEERIQELYRYDFEHNNTGANGCPYLYEAEAV